MVSVKKLVALQMKGEGKKRPWGRGVTVLPYLLAMLLMSLYQLSQAFMQQQMKGSRKGIENAVAFAGVFGLCQRWEAVASFQALFGGKHA